MAAIEKFGKSPVRRSAGEPGNRLQQLASPRALDPHHRENVTGAQLDLDVPKASPPVRPSRQPEQHLVAPLGPGGAGFPGLRRSRLLADNQLSGESLLGQGRAPQDRPALPLADDGHPVAIVNEFSKAVGDDDDDPVGLLPHPQDVSEELFRFLVGQGGVRFIEKEEAGVAKQSPGDLGELPDDE